jgi:RsiW-degrading membrane proteinase PrsW (M82 family)
MAKRPGGVMLQNSLPTRSQLIPVLTKWQDLRQKSALLPVVVTIVFVLGMYAAMQANPYDLPIDFQGDFHLDKWPTVGGQPVYTTYLIILVAVYLNLASLYFIYRLAGKKKSAILLLGVAIFTGYLLMSPVFGWAYDFFYGFLAGGEPGKATDFPTRLYRFVIGTGFLEELLKAVPIFLLLIITKRLKPEHRQAYGVEEPLDGILIGAASAAGFAIVETVGQYISSTIEDAWVHGAQILVKVGLLSGRTSIDAAKGLMMSVMGCTPGVGLAIPRSLDQAFGHMAYSGYLGYFIGLAALKPRKSWQIFGIGLISAAIVHGLWDAVPGSMTLFKMLIATASYAVMAAAILKAREISPQRPFLQPSIVFGAEGFAGAPKPAIVVEPQPIGQVINLPPAERAALPPQVLPPRPAGSMSLKLGTRQLVIVAGLKLLSHQIAGLKPANEGEAVAEVTRNPQDPAVLGLKNLSASAWEVVTTQGNRHDIQPAQTVRLTLGTKIDFGSVDGEVV